MASGDFVCDHCGNLDNIHATPTTSAGYLCSRCLNGEWHGQFREERYDPEEHFDVLNRVNVDRPSFS